MFRKGKEFLKIAIPELQKPTLVCLPLLKTHVLFPLKFDYLGIVLTTQKLVHQISVVFFLPSRYRKYILKTFLHQGKVIWPEEHCTQREMRSNAVVKGIIPRARHTSRDYLNGFYKGNQERGRVGSRHGDQERRGMSLV